MPQLRGMRLAVDMATRRRDGAAQALGEAVQRERQAQLQLAQLESYADETEARWALSSRSSASPELMRHYDQFMDRLRQAIGMQSTVVAEQRAAASQARKALADAEMHLTGLTRVLDARRTALERVRDRREQKWLDELAATQFLRARVDRLDMEAM